MALRRIVNRRRLLVVAFVVVLAWVVTATLGVRAAETALMSRVCGGNQVPRVPSIKDVNAGPAIQIKSFAVAPFVIRVDYDYIGFIWCGEGGVADVLWIPGRAQILRKQVRWFS